MRGQFKRSAVYGIVGVFVTAGLCVWVALTMGQPEDDPKPAYALIFGIVGVYVIRGFEDLLPTATSLPADGGAGGRHQNNRHAQIATRG